MKRKGRERERQRANVRERVSVCECLSSKTFDVKSVVSRKNKMAPIIVSDDI